MNDLVGLVRMMLFLLMAPSLLVMYLVLGLLGPLLLRGRWLMLSVWQVGLSQRGASAWVGVWRVLVRFDWAGRDVQCTHSHPEHHPLPVSLEPELDFAHTHQCYSLSQAAEQSGESHHVLMVMAWWVRGGELPLSRTLVDPELLYGQISTSQKPFLRRMLTARRCTKHGPCCWKPNHHVWYFWLLWVLSGVCGGKWVRSWEEASHMSDLWEDFPVPEQSERISCHVSTQPKHFSCHVSSVKCGFLERLTARSSGVQKCGGSHGGLHGTSSDLERYAG